MDKRILEIVGLTLRIQNIHHLYGVSFQISRMRHMIGGAILMEKINSLYNSLKQFS
jgi:hypothetical protein